MITCFRHYDILAKPRSRMTKATTFPAKMTLVHARQLLSNRKVSITFTTNGKREFEPQDQDFHSSVVYCNYNYTKIDWFAPILSMRIVLSCFYLLISHFENFSTWISRLLFAVSAMLNLSIKKISYSQSFSCLRTLKSLICTGRAVSTPECKMSLHITCRPLHNLLLLL